MGGIPPIVALVVYSSHISSHIISHALLSISSPALVQLLPLLAPWYVIILPYRTSETLGIWYGNGLRIITWQPCSIGIRGFRATFVRAFLIRPHPGPEMHSKSVGLRPISLRNLRKRVSARTCSKRKQTWQGIRCALTATISQMASTAGKITRILLSTPLRRYAGSTLATTAQWASLRPTSHLCWFVVKMVRRNDSLAGQPLVSSCCPS